MARQSQPIHTDYHADYESQDSLQGSFRATSSWWWMWIGAGIIAALINPFAIIGVVVAYPIIDRLLWNKWHNMISFIWRSRFSICLVLTLVVMILISAGIHYGSQPDVSTPTDSAERSQTNDYYIPESSRDAPNSEGISLNDSEVLINPQTIESYPEIQSSIDSNNWHNSCWDKFLNQRPGMKAWAEANPTLAAKERARRC